MPVFLDFRGRIYRSGILHFHERDLARSLIQFADCKSSCDMKKLRLASAFHYKSFASYHKASEWWHHFESQSLSHSDGSLLHFASKAKQPFQFLSSVVTQDFAMKGIEEGIYYDNIMDNIPITQDASASAYQIMSYFLLDERIAVRTNLISANDSIQDLYSYILEELKDFFQTDDTLDKNLIKILCEKFDRKIVKSIFMPIIYGKTVMSTASDFKEIFFQYITLKECFIVASSCFRFWRMKYHNMDCLIRLIQNIGWIASSSNRSVSYKVDYFTTVQDYMKMKPIHLWVYDRHHKKRRKVTLRVSSDERDRRKTETSTFVNFIHQRDAHIAMKVVAKLLQLGCPIYTVHDNFITTSNRCNYVSLVYNRVISEMGPPLSIINEFIYMNVIQPLNKERNLSKKDFFEVVISNEMLQSYLTLNIPDKVNNRQRKTWEERISTILTCYKNYTRLVCGDYQCDTEGWKGHQAKFEKFNQKLMRKSSSGHFYSLHY